MNSWRSRFTLLGIIIVTANVSRLGMKGWGAMSTGDLIGLGIGVILIILGQMKFPPA